MGTNLWSLFYSPTFHHLDFFYASILGIRLRDLSLLSRIQNHRETKKYDSQEIYIFSGENISAYMRNLFRNLKSSGKVLYICLLFVCHTWGQTLNARTDFYLFLPPLSIQTWQSEMAIRIKIFEIHLFTFCLPPLRTNFERSMEAKKGKNQS